MGYTQSMNDHSLFINSFEGSFTTLLVYVDDIILIGNDKEEIARIKQALNQTFKIKDLGNLLYWKCSFHRYSSLQKIDLKTYVSH